MIVSSLPDGAVTVIGVIGAGQMGSGIAHVFALGGFEVFINDVKADQITRALATIDGNMTRQVARGKISEDEKNKALQRLHRAESFDKFRDVDIAIEAAAEDERVKRELFLALCPKLKSGAIITTNTSSLSITRLAAITDRPERFMGVHFMNPVPVMQLVEVIRGIATDDETFQTVKSVVTALGKTIVYPEDFPPLSSTAS